MMRRVLAAKEDRVDLTVKLSDDLPHLSCAALQDETLGRDASDSAHVYKALQRLAVTSLDDGQHILAEILGRG